MDIGDKVIKDVGEAYILLHDRVPELEQRIEELERDYALVCKACEDQGDHIERLQRQADCPYTHVHMSLCTKCGWYPQELPES